VFGAAALLFGTTQLESCSAPCSSRGGFDDHEEDLVREIGAVLHEQELAWNRGDLVAFMERGYWRSSELTFFSGGKVSHGFDEMLAHYRASYAAPGKEFGRLAFSENTVDLLADDAAIARGRWDLDYAEKPDVGGLFTLVLRRVDEGWRIVHDHTSVNG